MSALGKFRPAIFGVVTILTLLPAWAIAASRGTTPPAGPPALAPAEPASTQTEDAWRLFIGVGIVSGVVFLLICAALAWAFFKYSARPGDTEEPKQTYGNRRLEIIWTIIPGVILAGCFIATVYTMIQMNYTSAKAADRINVVAVGHQWWWEFKYSDPGERTVTANVLYIPMGKTALIHVTSVDVLHSFWDPQLGRQMEAIPNQTHTVIQTPTRTGTFPGACYELCGPGHTWMQFREVVVSQAKFDAWIKHQQSPAHQPPVSNARAAAGENLFLTLSCTSCHTVNSPGFPTEGTFAPNLTHEASKEYIASVMPMSEPNLVRWLNTPNKYKQGVFMPGFSSLGKKEVDELAAYIWQLR